MDKDLIDVVNAAISLNNYDFQQMEFFRKTKGLADPRAKEIYLKLENRLWASIIDAYKTLSL